MAEKIPWDDICNIYTGQFGVSRTGRPPISPRIVIGALIIKQMCNLDDRETVAQIAENMYMQYFLGYSCFNPEPSFDASLFVEFRTRMRLDQSNTINERIHVLYQGIEAEMRDITFDPKGPDANLANEGSTLKDSGLSEPTSVQDSEVRQKGRVLFYITACRQNIACSTDLGLLSESRQK